MPMPRRVPWRPAVALVFLSGVLYVSQRPELRALLDYAVFEAKLQQWRPYAETAWAPALLVALSALATVVSFPQIVVIVAAGLLFPAPVAFAGTWVGCNLGALATYGIARQLGGDPFFVRLRERWGNRLPAGRQTATLMFWLRLTMFQASPLNWLPGLTGMPLRNYMLGGTLGTLPWVAGVLLVTQKIRTARTLDASVLLQWELGLLLGASAIVAVALRATVKKSGAGQRANPERQAP